MDTFNKVDVEKAHVAEGDVSVPLNDVNGDAFNDEHFDKTDDDIETRCGILGFRPLFIQPLARVGCFTFTYGISALVTSTLSVYVNSQVTTLERQFGFNSNQTGLIMAANDVGFLICVLFVSYLASTLHIPKALGVMTIVYGVSGLICCLPHFMFGHILNLDPTAKSGDIDNVTSLISEQKRKSQLYGDLCVSDNNTTIDMCLGKDSSEEKSSEQSQSEIVNISLVVIFIGMMIQGFGKAPRSSYTVTYIDGNAKKTNTGFYMGVIITMGIFGPALAFLIGGVFSRIYVTLEPTNLNPKHPKWIGAWWLGYIVFGFLGIFVSLPLFCFPRRLPRRERKGLKERTKVKTEKKGRNQLMSLGSNIKPSQKQGPAPNVVGYKNGLWFIKDFLSTLFRLLTNPVYMSVVLATCFKVFVIGGSIAFTPKYLEEMFDMPAYKANYIIAIVIMVASCLGTFIGGYLSKKLKMTASSALKFSLAAILISLAANLSGLTFACDQPTVHGGPVSPLDCNDACACTDNSYFPICGNDGKTYYSPCFAGCADFEDGVYSNCTCITSNGGAVLGTCSYSCDNIYAYAIAKAISSLFAALWIIPKIIIVIRCVSEKDKPMALGFSSFMTSFLGWMIGPIIFGNFIDTVCDVWDVKCSGRGRCLLYDNDQLRIKFHGYTSLVLACSVACIVFACIYAWYTGCLLDDEEKHRKIDKEKEETRELCENGEHKSLK